MSQMAAKNFHISDFLKICIEVRFFTKIVIGKKLEKKYERNEII